LQARRAARRRLGAPLWLCYAVGAVRHLPIIDVSPLVTGAPAAAVAEKMRSACEDVGFFYVVAHGVPEPLQLQLETLSRRFFAQDLATKMRIRMELGGRAWRGYFPVGGELTSGRPDRKEGIYFGAELADDDPRVVARTPMHGRNLFPDLPGFRPAVLAYLDAMTALGHALMRGIGLSLGLEPQYFARRYTRDPLILFRIFNYPRQEVLPSAEWGVGEHTDYGVLTILRQDETGGLEVKSRSGWIAAPPLPGAFVCNIGDMLDRMTAGRYRSTPHRVRHTSERDRLSFPFFFDPDFFARVEPILAAPAVEDRDERWDGQSLRELGGTYGDYLLAKVAKVFPQLQRSVL
jgi:isopenicillin N synthase-like dioxygenase